MTAFEDHNHEFFIPFDRLGEGAEKPTREYYGFTKAVNSAEGGQFYYTDGDHLR
jgi:hypothetical protein